MAGEMPPATPPFSFLQAPAPPELADVVARKQFALLKPATRTALEIGLNLPGTAGTDRLRPASGMCTHTVRVSSVEEVDGELHGWLRAAYERA